MIIPKLEACCGREEVYVQGSLSEAVVSRSITDRHELNMQFELGKGNAYSSISSRNVEFFFAKKNCGELNIKQCRISRI